VETRIAHLVASGRVETRVIAPVPFTANVGIVPKDYRELGEVPRAEERRGIAITHPRYLVIPKVGMTVAPALLYLAARASAAALLRSGYDFDVIDAHYFYPDGVAAAMLGRQLGKPVVITARGTDINLIPAYRLPRAMIRWAAREAAGIITVCAALRDALVALDVPAAKIRVLRNGVDLTLFQPRDREVARNKAGFVRPTLLSVGHLIPRKGHDLTIGAMPLLPGFDLAIAGEGPEHGNLESQARRLGVADRVRLLGSVPQSALAELYSAADLLVLASSREGWANVLLEAMACGTPVVASNVWGTPEVVAAPEAGELMDERTPDAIARSVQRLAARLSDRTAVRAYAERFSWDDTTRGQIELFTQIASATRASRGDAARLAAVTHE
jgi:glycosyltransferase involved in cell wall biosynthesis